MRIALVGLLLAGASLPAAPPALAAQASAARCGGALRPEADAESFAAAGRDAGALARETGTNFVAAASSLCGSGALRAAHLAPFTRLVVRNAEGNTDPVVYDDAEQGPDSLILEYAFIGAAPSAAAIGNAIRCWREPTRAGCDQAVD